MPLNDNAKKWVEALRSGEFRQVQQRLRGLNNEVHGPEFRYCCLGVACELYKQAHPGIAQWDEDHIFYPDINEGEDEYGDPDPEGSEDQLPFTVMNWLGLHHNGGNYGDPENEEESLIHKNDSGSTFQEIADLIESEPEGLFS